MEAPQDVASAEVRPVGRRWLMLALFFLVTMANGFQWIQFAIISNSVAWFYGVSTQAVQWTSLMYMVLYIPCILPALWFLDAKGLGWTVKLAAVGNCLAAWLKVAAARPDLIGVLFAGQSLAAATQVLVLSTPPRLAAVWFGAHQVSTATAVGVIGNQVGNALGFVVPSLLVRSPNQPGTTVAAMQEDMTLVGYIVAASTTAIAVLVFIGFQKAPPVAPSVAQAALRLHGRSHGGTMSEFKTSVKAVLASPGYLYLLVTNAINTGVTLAAATVLNDLILSVFPDSEDDAGFIGLVMVVAGLVGAVISGLVLDFTAKFKEMTVGMYGLSVVSLVVFTATMFAERIWAVYIAGALAGLSLAGYVAVGFEFAAELTYPEPEGTSSGLLNAASMVLGIAFTVASGALLPLAGGWRWACALMTAVLLVGAAVSLAIPNNLRRQAAQRAAHTLRHPGQ